MKLRIVKTPNLYDGYQPVSWKVQQKFFFWWQDCVDGVDGNSFVPKFARYQAAETFGQHYANVRNKKALFV